MNHKEKIYVIDDAHTNGIEGFWSTVKRCFVGVLLQDEPQAYAILYE